MTQQTDPSDVLAGGGEMGALMRTTDWRRTAVGPVSGWPQSLRTALSILLETGFPMYIAWGREFTQFYNDGYRPILGSTKHPAAMGLGTRQTFAEIWDVIGPMFEGVMQGHATTLVDFMLPLDRHGFAEECYFVFSYSPIREESGQVGGVLVTVTETTARVLGERRLKTTQALAAETREARSVAEACAIAAQVLAASTSDLPSAQIYLCAADGSTATAMQVPGAPPLAAPLPPTLRRDDEPLRSLMSASGPALWLIDGARATPLDLAAETPAAGRVLALPITHQGADQPVGLLVATTSDRLLLTAEYRDFLRLAASQIGTAIATAQALEEAQARADALAALDRAKTAFFSNVSHEFRTPLTLMVGPTEEALATPERALQGEELLRVHRNGLRLLKLVNTLLYFSRIEAGRVNASFEPTDLSVLTADLCSAFRSATERAGIVLQVRCPPLQQPVVVDTAMWEKIVLNLLSNAFKFTLEGSITVTLGADATHAELRVRDTGVGIAAEDLPHVFDRFYRIPRTQGRSHEGSGIGLALVRELVGIHGGTIDVSSVDREGSEFVVRIPLGSAHLPPDLLTAASAPGPQQPATPTVAQSFVEEALRWLPGESPAAPAPAPTAANRAAAARVLVADDNADMRDYLERLLSPRLRVDTAADGHAALNAVRRHHPDVVVSDVMMPGLDGFELLRAMRADEATRAIPLILLSARAGEEARIEGLRAGADDYLTKPFSARELLARVDAQLMRLQLRSLEQAHATRLASIFELAPVGVAILQGPEHRFEFANRAYLDLIDGRPVVGQSVRDALPELAGQNIYELLDQVYASGEAFVGRSIAVSLRRGDKTSQRSFFDFVYQPLFDDDQCVTGIAVVAFDVSELTTARREAEAANRAKDEFLAMLGHELRNPLAPIVTALHLMRLRNVSGAERERAIIERQVMHLVRLVDDLLDVSRITRGQVQLKQDPLDVADIVAKALEMSAPAIEQRSHRLRVDVPRGLTMTGDTARLAQVVSNLLSNAAKYTDPGGSIDIVAARVGDAVQLVVSDNGRGIAADVLPRVFELFAQERQEIDRSDGGLGLGLAIVKSLVLAHGGSVHAHSDGKGRGARFTITLPLPGQPRTDARPAVAAAALPFSAMRILVVDDNADAAEMLATSLSTLGHATEQALSGSEALQAVSSFRPHAVLLDLGLPSMDGFEVARRIRGLPGGASIALVAVTGYGRDVDQQRAREAGFDEHMVKPVDLHALHGWLLDAAAQPGLKR